MSGMGKMEVEMRLFFFTTKPSTNWQSIWRSGFQIKEGKGSVSEG
jgi:hypothetical protein